MMGMGWSGVVGMRVVACSGCHAVVGQYPFDLAFEHPGQE